MCDAENVLDLDRSGGYTCEYICNNQAKCLRLLHYMYLAVCILHLGEKKKKSLKEDAYFHVTQTIPIRQGGLLVPCCSDQAVTSPDDSCVHVSLFIPVLLLYPPITATLCV